MRDGGKKGTTFTLTDGYHWPEMERVSILAGKVMLNMGRLEALARNAAAAGPGDYAAHMGATIGGYRRGILRAATDLLALLGEAGHSQPREVSDDGAPTSDIVND